MNADRRTTTRHLLLAVGLLSLGGCVQTTVDEGDGIKLKPPPTQQQRRGNPQARGDRPYYRATPQVQQDVVDLMDRVRSANPSEWQLIARKLAAYGEPAIPTLLRDLAESDERRQIMAAYVLGIIKDPRALDALHRATFDPKDAVRFEAATSMLRIGDRRGLGTMVGGLEDPDPLVRARSILVLEANTGQTFGYLADARPGDRAAAVSRWRAWLVQSGGASQG